VRASREIALAFRRRARASTTPRRKPAADERRACRDHPTHSWSPRNPAATLRPPVLSSCSSMEATCRRSSFDLATSISSSAASDPLRAELAHVADDRIRPQGWPSAGDCFGDVRVVSPGSEPGAPRSISQPVRNAVGWALSLARCETRPIRERSPAFELARVREGALSGRCLPNARSRTAEDCRWHPGRGYSARRSCVAGRCRGRVCLIRRGTRVRTGSRESAAHVTPLRELRGSVGAGQVYVPTCVGDGVITSRSLNVKLASRARRTGQVSATFSRRLT
jgi:hypothetical protein